jgi:hypothetical protein
MIPVLASLVSFDVVLGRRAVAQGCDLKWVRKEKNFVE